MGTEVTTPVVSIKEMNDDYQVILLEYIMSSVGDSGNSEYYNVEEYYRVRVGAEKIYLLSFERMRQEMSSVLCSRENCGATIRLKTI